jgi:hypothetical protein
LKNVFANKQNLEWSSKVGVGQVSLKTIFLDNQNVWSAIDTWHQKSKVFFFFCSSKENKNRFSSQAG